jgi:aldose 1-epimerase
MDNDLKGTLWGQADGTPVRRFTLVNRQGLMMRVINLGCIVTEMHVPDRAGTLADVTSGFDSLEGYLAGHPYFGAICGRVANRIADGRFTLDGKSYTLATNNPPNHLHGGVKGFDKVIWNAVGANTPAGPSVTFTHTSPAGDEGYPGRLDVTVVYTLTHDNTFRIDMSATCDAPTIVNLVNHAYWNLAGHGHGSIREHDLQVHATSHTPKTGRSVPDGTLAPVGGTPFDFRQPKPIGRDLMKVFDVMPGYDDNFVVDGPVGTLRPAAKLVDPLSGRVMEVLTDQPGVQVYTGNFLDGTLRGKGGIAYPQHSLICLETQNFPDAINHPTFPSPILRPGQTYRHTMVHRFGVA